MDFKDWKIKSADGKKATLVHKDGHFMSIALKGLSRIQQQQIQRLAGGGTVKMPARKRMADGGTATLDPDKVKQFQQGFNGTPTPTPPPPKPETQPVPVSASSRMNYDEGTPDGPVSNNPPPLIDEPIDDDLIPQPMTINGNREPASIGDRLIAPDKALDVPAAVSQEQDATSRMGELEGAKARGAIAPEEEYLLQRDKQAQRDIDNLSELRKHTQEFDQYQQENPVDPRHYAQSMTSHQRGMTALGLLLGGMAGQGHGNASMDFLNNQINRDVDAQKANFDQRHTVWGAYHHLYGDAVIANNLAKVSSLDLLQHKAALVAAKLGTPMAAAQYDALAVKLGFEREQSLQNAAGRLNTLRTGGGGVSTAPQQGTTRPNDQTGENSPIPGESTPPMLESILHPGSEVMMKGMQYNPLAKPHLEKLQQQYDDATQADKGLAEIARIYGRMADEAREGGIVGRIHRSSPHAMAVAGGALGTGIGAAVGAGAGAIPGGAIGAGLGEVAGQATHGLTATATNRRYDVDKSALFGVLSSALKHSNITATQIGEVIDKASPDDRDGPKEIKQKLREIEKLIKNNTDTSLLKMHGLTHKTK